MKHLWKFALCFGLATTITSCSEDDNTNTSQGTSTVKFNLTDAPAAYDAVNIDIEEVYVHIGEEGDSAEGWEELENINPGIYDLLELQNGIDTVLAQDEVGSGRLSQIRLVLGSDNSVVKDGQTHALQTPSAQQSGLKLNVNYELQPELEYEFWLDFDASRSVVEKGNGGFLLKPVIRVFTKTTTGSIKGYASPVDAQPWVMVYNQAGDTATALADGQSGYFLLSGLAPGTYELEAEPDTAYSLQTISNISVTQGAVADVDTIKF